MVSVEAGLDRSSDGRQRTGGASEDAARRVCTENWFAVRVCVTSVVPPGLAFSFSFPGAEAPGYWQMPLRGRLSGISFRPIAQKRVLTHTL